MSTVGQREIKTQERVIQFCKDKLGYRYLGNGKTGSTTVTSRKTYWRIG